MKYYEKITHAREVLDIPLQATQAEIKKQYYELMKKVHPDVSQDHHDNHSRSVEITNAYRLISHYCENYRFSFEKSEVNKYQPVEELWLEKFGEDPAC